MLNERRRPPFNKCVVVCLIFSFFAFLVPTVSFAKDSNEDLVYCPLQKEWVKRSDSSKRFQPSANLQLDICSTSNTRKAFLLAAGATSGTSEFLRISQNLDTLIFEYSSKGRSALTFTKTHREDTKNNRLLIRSSEGLTASAIQIEISAPPRAIVALKDTNSFVQRHQQFVKTQNLLFDLDNISRNINPRSPPPFLV